MTDTAWIWILCTITALGMVATFGLVELATRRKNRWWAQTEQAAADASDPDADHTVTFDPAKELLRTNDLAYYAHWPAVVGGFAAIAAIAFAPAAIIQLIGAIGFALSSAAASYAYTKRRQITAPSHKP